MCADRQTSIHTCGSMHSSVYAHMHTFVCVHMNVLVCMCVRVCIYVCVYMYYMNVLVCTCVYVCMCVYVYIRIRISKLLITQRNVYTHIRICNVGSSVHGRSMGCIMYHAYIDVSCIMHTSKHRLYSETCSFVYVYVHIYVCMYVCKVCMHAWTYIHMYAWTYIHMHTNSGTEMNSTYSHTEMNSTYTQIPK